MKPSIGPARRGRTRARRAPQLAIITAAQGIARRTLGCIASRVVPSRWSRPLLALAVERLPETIAYPASSTLARAVWYSSPRRRALHHRRARVAINGGSPQQISAVARESWQATVLAYLDAQRLGRSSTPRAAIVGAEHLRRARDAGRGVVLVTAHLGAPELGAIALADAGFDLITMGGARSPRSAGWVRRLMRAGRERSRLTILEPNLAGVRAASAHLRRGGVVAILGDVDAPGTGAEVDFLSGRATLPTLPVALALRTRADLIPGSAIRVGGRARCTITIQPALELPRGGNRRDQIRLGIELLARALSESIGAAPGQWFRGARWVPGSTAGPRLAGPPPQDRVSTEGSAAGPPRSR